MAMTSSEILERFKSCDKKKPMNYYLFDREKFDQHLSDFRGVFAKVSPSGGLIIGYSTKTNPHPSVLNAAMENGCYAEIVSPHELQLALSVGFRKDRIIYNGIIPDPEGKFDIAQNNGIVNLESALEVEQIVKIADEQGKNIKIGLRLNIDIGNGRKSRFGIDPDTPEFQYAINLISASKYVDIQGFHSHVYGGRDIEYWKRRSLAVAKIARKYHCRYIDLGSNMYGFMDERMMSQFQCTIPKFSEYAFAIAESFYQSFIGTEQPVLILEPGTPLISDCVSVLARIENIREIRGDVIATLSCSEYDCGFTPATKNVPIDVIHTGENTPSEYDDLNFYGYTCTEGDVLHRHWNGKAAIGDLVLLRNVGAYSYSLSNSFIMPPAEFIEI